MDQLSSRVRRGQSAFTLVEVLVAITIVGLLLAVSVPGGARLYESIQYRQAVRDVVGLLSTARHAAVDSGRPQDVAFDPQQRLVTSGETRTRLPEGFRVAVTSARELNQDQLGVIRFYPEGDSTGGDIQLESPTGRGVHIKVDWLMGSISQASYDTD